MPQQCQSLNLLQGLWLPDASPSWPLQAPLMLLVDRLFFYRPLGSGKEEELASFAAGAVCFGINPVVDDDCETLAAMIADVAVHGEEFLLGQLSAMTDPAPGPETAVSRLIGQLRSGVIDDNGREAVRGRLNRARLLLALAELHQRQEEEVALGLARAEARQRDLMGTLTANPAPFTARSSGYRSTVKSGALLKAWLTLWALDSSPPGAFVACAAESWEVILDDAVPGDPLLTLDLPFPGDGDDPAAWIRNSRAGFAGLLPAVAGFFADPDSLPPEAAVALEREWNALVADDCRGRLSVYDMGRCRIPALFCESGKDGDKERGKHGLIAVLSRE